MKPWYLNLEPLLIATQSLDEENLYPKFIKRWCCWYSLRESLHIWKSLSSNYTSIRLLNLTLRQKQWLGQPQFTSEVWRPGFGSPGIHIKEMDMTACTCIPVWPGGSQDSRFQTHTDHLGPHGEVPGTGRPCLQQKVECYPTQGCSQTLMCAPCMCIPKHTSVYVHTYAYTHTQTYQLVALSFATTQVRAPFFRLKEQALHGK